MSMMLMHLAARRRMVVKGPDVRRAAPMRPRPDHVAAMAKRHNKQIERHLVWDRLGDDTYRFSVGDEQGRELVGGVTDDAADTLLGIAAHVVPPGTKGL